MSRGTQVSLEVQRKVEELLLVEGVTSKGQIYGELQRLELIDAGGSPSKSTIDRLVDRLTSSDASEPWSVAEADPEEAQLALDVLLYMFQRSNGRVWLTRDIAAWVARLRRASPEIPPAWAYIMATMYQRNRGRVGDVPLLDLMLALRPWKNADDPDLWKIVQGSDRDSFRMEELFKTFAEIIVDLVKTIQRRPVTLDETVGRARARAERNEAELAD